MRAIKDIMVVSPPLIITKEQIDEMHDLVKNTKEFPRLNIDKDPIRFSYNHPLLFEDGSFISTDHYMFKIDFCSLEANTPIL